MAACLPMLDLALLAAISYAFASRAVFENNGSRGGPVNGGSFGLAAVGAAAWSGRFSQSLLHSARVGIDPSAGC